MPTLLGINFQVFCAICHHPMCGEVIAEEPTVAEPLPTVKVMPCPRCMGEALGEGAATGYRHGSRAGEMRQQVREGLLTHAQAEAESQRPKKRGKKRA